MEVRKTKFYVDGKPQPCFVVTGDNGVKVRISKHSYLFTRDTLDMWEFVDGKLNRKEEWVGCFDLLSKADALRMASQFTAYL